MTLPRSMPDLDRPTPLVAPLVTDPGDTPLDLREIDLRDAVLAGADLTDADLQHACLAAADLAGATLRGARLARADLALACLQGADLRNADLSGADLSGADLRQAQLDGADLRDAELAWARLEGATGIPPQILKDHQRPADDREPPEAMRAWRQGTQAHAAGQWSLADRHYRTALRWVPESDAARHALGCLALERGEADQAAAWWQEAIRVDPLADRVRLDLALLELQRDRPAIAMAALEPIRYRRPELAEWIAPILAQLQAGELPAAVAALLEKAADSPGARWYAKPRTVAPRARPVEDAATRLGDEGWVTAERADLQALLQQRQQPAWLWQSVVVRALGIGALDLAQRAEQRLTQVAPEQRLWGLELKHLDITAQAFEALVRTRWGQLGTVLSVRWVALGAHGPTARIHCEGGVYYAKRYLGAIRPAGSVAFTHRVARFLRERGLNVPVAVPDDSGDDVMLFGDDLLALYPDLGGVSIRELDLDEATAGEVGALLGRIHRLGADLGVGTGRPRAGVRIGTRVLRQRRPAQAWQAAVGVDPACAAHLDRHPLGRRLGSLLEATGRRLRSVVSGCPTGLVHGDFGAGNVLHARDGGYAVVDWDLADADLLVWDLARTLDLLGVWWPAEPGTPVELRPGLLRALVAGYVSERPLLPAERAALPLLVAASRVDLDASVLPLCVPLESEVAEPILERQLVRLSRAAAGAPELAEALAHP